MKVLKKNKDLKLIKFKDKYNSNCTLETFSSSLCMWLGCDESSRMCLTKKQVKMLIPHLIQFVEMCELKANNNI